MGKVNRRLHLAIVAEALPVPGVRLVVVGVVGEEQVSFVSSAVVVDSGEMRAVAMGRTSNHTHYTHWCINGRGWARKGHTSIAVLDEQPRKSLLHLENS